MEYLRSQFGHPRGILGRLVGMLLSRRGDRLQWALEQLSIQPEEKVLEVGFGPGVAIKAAAEIATFVAGVDVSELMVQQARKRNRAAVRAGKVDLRVGTADQLPFEAETFNKAFAINSYHIWPDGAAGLRESTRVMRFSGRVAIIEQPPLPNPAVKESQIRQRGEHLVDALAAAQFHHITSAYTELERGWIACIQGIK